MKVAVNLFLMGEKGNIKRRKIHFHRRDKLSIRILFNITIDAGARKQEESKKVCNEECSFILVRTIIITMDGHESKWQFNKEENIIN